MTLLYASMGRGQVTIVSDNMLSQDTPQPDAKPLWLVAEGNVQEDGYATVARKKRKICERLVELREELTKLPDPAASAAHQEKLAELRKSLVQLYDSANRAEKRMIVENVWPNRVVSGKKPAFEPYSWVLRVENTPTLLGGTPERDSRRSGHHIPPDDMSLIQPLFDLLAAANGSEECRLC